MSNQDEKYPTGNQWDRDKYHLHPENTEEGDHTREGKWEDQKEKCYEDRPEIEEDHRVVELDRDIDMTYRHTGRGSEGFDYPHVFEYDEILRICKTHIQKEGKEEVSTHHVADHDEIFLSEESEEKDVEGDDREGSKNRYDVMCFE